jgi:hypothetical protein
MSPKFTVSKECVLNNPVTREEYLRNDSVTRELLVAGISQEQLASVKLRGQEKGLPFILWNICLNDIPNNLVSTENFSRLNYYATLKWLLESDGSVADREAAWARISATRAEPIFTYASDTRKAQSVRARKSRGKLLNSDLKLRELVEAVVLKNPSDRTADELWTSLYSRLEEEMLTPRYDGPPGDPPPGRTGSHMRARGVGTIYP